MRLFTARLAFALYVIAVVVATASVWCLCWLDEILPMARPDDKPW